MSYGVHSFLNLQFYYPFVAAVYTPGLSEHRLSGSYTGTRYAHADMLGSLTFLSDSTQTSTAGYGFDAYGSLASSWFPNGADPTPFGWLGDAGCQTDHDSGLVLMGYRYYDTRTGSFITQDPAGDGDNWYAYAGNNPVILSDPLGLITKEDADAGGAAYANGEPGLYDFWQVTNGDYANAKYLYTKQVGFGNSLMPTALNGDIYLNFPGGSDFLNRRLQYAKVEYQHTKPDIFGDPFVSAMINADRLRNRGNWFKAFVHGGGKWDIKNTVNATTDPDLHQLRENAGNFLYGAIGSGLHFGEQTLLYGAGWAQVSDNGLVNAMSHILTHFDDPEGQGEIEAGIAWYESGAHTYSIASP